MTEVHRTHQEAAQNFFSFESSPCFHLIHYGFTTIIPNHWEANCICLKAVYDSCIKFVGFVMWKTVPKELEGKLLPNE